MSWEDEEFEFSMPAETAAALGIQLAGTGYDSVTAELLNEQGSAYDRGMRAGDSIRTINGIRPYNAEHAREVMGRRSIHGDIHKVKVIRPGLRRSLERPLWYLLIFVLAYLAYAYGPSLGIAGQLGLQDEL